MHNGVGARKRNRNEAGKEKQKDKRLYGRGGTFTYYSQLIVCIRKVIDTDAGQQTGLVLS